MLHGLWPKELAAPRDETAALARHLREDLLRIADKAIEKVEAIRRHGLRLDLQAAEEMRVINVARAFAVLRVESAVEVLNGSRALSMPQEFLAIAGPIEPAQSTFEPRADAGAREERTEHLERAKSAMSGESAPGAVDATRSAAIEVLRMTGIRAEELTELSQLVQDPTSPSEGAQARPPRHAAAGPAANAKEDEPRPAARPGVASASPGRAAGNGPAQDGQSWLQSVIIGLARQEPALRWLVGERADGKPVVATDVASGWIPPGVVLPARAVVLEPARRSGRLDDWVGAVQRRARYKPGDRIDGRFRVPTKVVEEPFAVVEIDDLGWRLGEATRVDERLPRIAHTLAKAGAARTGVADAEMDVLRMHVQTAVKSVLSGYPDVDEPAVVSCMLLGAAEAMAAGRRVLAAYHMAWYEAFAGQKVWA